MNGDVFLLFLESIVFPSLATRGPRVFMWDNLSSHLTAQIRGQVSARGHSMLSRPSHSPDFAPVEWCFGEMDAWLRQREGVHSVETYAEAVGDAAAALGRPNIRSYFAKAHYFVPELAFKPYDGEQ